MFHGFTTRLRMADSRRISLRTMPDEATASYIVALRSATKDAKIRAQRSLLPRGRVFLAWQSVSGSYALE